MRRAGLGQAAAKRVIGGKARLKPRHALRRLAGFQRRGIIQIIEPAPGVGLDIAEGLILLAQIGQHPGQGRVLVDIRRIARVIMVLIAEHGGW